jgi:hypothetical protein
MVIMSKKSCVVAAALVLSVSSSAFSIGAIANESVASSPAQQTSVKPFILELDVEKNAKCNVFTLSNPARLIVDVKGGAAKTEFDKASLVNTPIKGVRSAKHENGTLRIVFDLQEGVAFKVQEKDSGAAIKTLAISVSPKK